METNSSDIVIYPNRRRMLGWIALSGIPTLCLVPFIIGPLIFMMATPDGRNQIGAIIALVLFMGSLFAMSAWLTWMLISVAFSGEPTLVINRAGIRVGKIYGSANIFVPWKEVEAVYSSPRPPYTIFFIRPVDTKRFLERLSPMMRLTCRISAMGGAPIALYQSFLDQPAGVILEQMHTHYKQELQLHKEYKREEAIPRLEPGTKEIILYTSRLLLWAPLFLGSASLFLACLMFFNNSQQLPELLGSAFLVILGIFFGPITIWKSLRTPLLIINDEGICCSQIFMRTEIKWEEIDALYGKIGERLLIDASPAGIVAVLTRQNKGKLVIPRHMDITVPQTVLVLPQTMLPLPLDRLLEQIRERFQDQLAHYGIETDVY